MAYIEGHNALATDSGAAFRLAVSVPTPEWQAIATQSKSSKIPTTGTEEPRGTLLISFTERGMRHATSRGVSRP